MVSLFEIVLVLFSVVLRSKKCCWFSLEWPSWGHSNDYPQLKLCKKMTKISLKSSFYLCLWTTNLSRWQSIIIQTSNKILFVKAMAVWVKISADDILKYFLFSWALTMPIFWKENKEIIIKCRLLNIPRERLFYGKRQTLYMHMWKMGLISKVIKRFEAHGSKLQNRLTFFFFFFFFFHFFPVRKYSYFYVLLSAISFAVMN